MGMVWVGVIAMGLVGCSLVQPWEGTSVERVLARTQDLDAELDQELLQQPAPTIGGQGREIASIPPVLTPRFQQPLHKMVVNSRFGRRNGSNHTGIDLKASYGTPVYAAFQGVVVYADDKIFGYGDTVILRHAGGFATLYAHASALRVKEGDFVTKGQCIAYAGDSGRASGPHLHFEIRRGTHPVDPVPFLWRAPARTPSRPVEVPRGLTATEKPRSQPSERDDDQ